MCLLMKVVVNLLSGRQPKARFSTRLPDGNFLSLAVWSGKSDPSAEVLTIQVRGLKDEIWETVGRLAVYRTSDGKYSMLPERSPVQAGKSESDQ
jgi:hypothetical protein